MNTPKSNRTRAAGAAAVATIAAGAAALIWSAAADLGPWRLDPTDPKVSLEDVEQEVTRRWPLPDILPAALAGMLAAGDIVLFDVRTREEYEAGHLPSAIHVEPGIAADAFLDLHRERLGAAPVVFYCAVGVRSSHLMARTLEQVAPLASAGIFNLRGGIFRWTADGRALVTPDGPGRAHPYDENWGRLLSRTTPRS